MNSAKSRRKECLVRLEHSLVVTAKSGLQVNILDDEWRLLPTSSKGYLIPIAWLHNSAMSDQDWHIIVDVYTHYVRTKAASTAFGVVGNTRRYFTDGIPELSEIKGKWSGLPTHQKKSLNQVFGTLCKLGRKRFVDYHNFTKNHLDKETNNNLDPTKGALTDIEFDSFAKLVNNKLASVDWSRHTDLPFYQSTAFALVRTAVASKLMLAAIRRPIQLSALKWCDLIPAGASFRDRDIEEMNEIGTLGASTLQLRIFHAKVKGSSNSRSHPERYPLHLSEELSLALVKYKRFCLRGVTLILEASDSKVEQEELLLIANNIPIFPSAKLFKWQVRCLETFKCAFTPTSTLFHATDQQLTFRFKVPSDRVPICRVSNNRIRHTALTRGAQQGLSILQLARITGVTVPAARHYVDMDYESRRLIDENYLGNEFLKRTFSGSVTLAPDGEEMILGHHFNEVGGVKSKPTCNTCKAQLGRPLGCYGCPNFRPFLEADHRAELNIAQNKLDANRKFLLNPLETGSIRKLEIQIEWVKLTIAICDELLLKQKAIDVK